MDESMMGRTQPVDEQGVETLKEGIEVRLMELASLLGPEETLDYVNLIVARMEQEIDEERG